MSNTQTGAKKQDILLTVLKAKVRQTKINKLVNGTFDQDAAVYSKRVLPRIEPVDGIKGLYDLLGDLQGEWRSCVVRGKPRNPGKWGNRRYRSKPDETEPPGLLAQSQRWIMLDSDLGKCPEDVDAVIDAKEYARATVRLLHEHVPEAKSTSVVVQLSAKAGTPLGAGKLKAHLWYILDTPIDDVSLKRWAKHVNSHAGFQLIDPKPFEPQQPHYTAAPICEGGWVDQLDKRLFLFKGKRDELSLTVPEAPTLPEMVKRERSTGIGEGDGEPNPDYAGWTWEGILEDKLGYEPGNTLREGFYEPLGQAAIRAAFKGVDQDEFRERAAQAIVDIQGEERDAYAEYVDGGKLDETIRSRYQYAADVRAKKEREREEMRTEAYTKYRKQEKQQRLKRAEDLLEIECAIALQNALEYDADFDEKPPMCIVSTSFGTGKTTRMLMELGAEENLCANWYAPNYGLLKRAAAQYELMRPFVDGFIISGRSYFVDGEPLCPRYEVAEKIAKAGLSVVRNLCAKCRHADTCGYWKQFRTLPENRVAFLTHAHLKHEPHCGKGNVAIIDENPISAFFAPKVLKLARLRDRVYLARIAEPLSQDQMIADAYAHESAAPEALIKRAAAAMLASLTQGADIDEGALEAAGGLLEARPVYLDGEKDDYAIKTDIIAKAAAERAAFKLLLDTMLSACRQGKTLAEAGIHVSETVVRFTNSSVPRAVQDMPVIALDATANADVYREAFGADFRVIDCRVPETARIVKVEGAPGSGWTLFGVDARIPDDKLTPAQAAKKLKRVSDILQRAAGRAAGRSVVIAAPKKFIDYAKAQDLIPKGMNAINFGALRGMNDFEKTGFMMIAGRNLPPVDEMERNRAAMGLKTGSKPVTVARYVDEHKPNYLPRHGYMGSDDQPWHPDRVTEGLRRQVSEAELLQAGGRLRSIRRDDEPEICVLSGLELDWGKPADETIKWSAFIQHGKKKLTEYIERCFDGFDVVPLGPADMIRLAPDLFEDARAATNALQDGDDEIASYAQGRYWRDGQRKPARFLRPLDVDAKFCERALAKALGCAVRVKKSE